MTSWPTLRVVNELPSTADLVIIEPKSKLVGNIN